MYRLRNAVADFCSAVANLFELLAMQLAVCEDCGRSRYYGEACRK